MSLKRSIVASCVMIFTLLCLSYINTAGKIVTPNRPLSTFPKQIGKWTGQEEHFDEKTYEILGVDDSFFCNYSTPDGRHLQIYIGFYQSQREGDLIHSPKHCMPGAGWNIVKTSSEEIALPNVNPGKIRAAKLLLEKGAQRQVLLYWFQSRGRFITSEYMQKIYLVVDAITKHRTDGSFIRLLCRVVDGQEEKASRDIRDFATLVLPLLQDYLPS